MTKSRFTFAILAATAVAGVLAGAQAAPTPFKLGTFAGGDGRPFVGIVLKESAVIEFAATTNMNDLIARYEQLRPQILDAIRTGKQVDVKTLKILPPTMPLTMLNVAVNYGEHDVEMARIRQGSPGQSTPTAGGALPNTTSAAGIWERRENDVRWNPFMFLKAPAAIVAEGEPVRLPPGRTRIEWECELGVVIGRNASRVATERAFDYVFGYTLENDMSDRGGRGDTRYGSDWLVTKNHDTFAPLGPFITPKEFIKDVQNLQIRFALNGKVLQEGTTNQMIHGINELVHYATNLLTLRPGDIIATGTIPGSGSARTPPILLKDGDRMVCTYEGVGTLTNPVVGS
jgi:2-keto-4-pentenoate hydratase/2-oxohepta-3-ene-1,7-dioic acid hydratase in catechol pathway